MDVAGVTYIQENGPTQNILKKKLCRVIHGKANDLFVSEDKVREKQWKRLRRVKEVQEEPLTEEEKPFDLGWVYARFDQIVNRPWRTAKEMSGQK